MNDGTMSLLFQYLHGVVGNVWSILLFASGAISLIERFFTIKFKIPRWVGVSLILLSVVIGQVVAYIKLSEAPPVVLNFPSPLTPTMTIEPPTFDEVHRPTAAPPAVANNAPNGFAISGGKVTDPTINNYAPPQRALSETQRSRLVSALKADVPYKIVERHAQGNFEAQTYAEALVSALRDGGWDVNDKPGFVYETRQGQGVKILVNDTKNPPPGAIILQNAFKQAGIDAGGASMPDQIGPKDMLLYIGVQ